MKIIWGCVCGWTTHSLLCTTVLCLSLPEHHTLLIIVTALWLHMRYNNWFLFFFQNSLYLPFFHCLFMQIQNKFYWCLHMKIPLTYTIRIGLNLLINMEKITVFSTLSCTCIAYMHVSMCAHADISIGHWVSSFIILPYSLEIGSPTEPEAHCFILAWLPLNSFDPPISVLSTVFIAPVAMPNFF